MDKEEHKLAVLECLADGVGLTSIEIFNALSDSMMWSTRDVSTALASILEAGHIEKEDGFYRISESGKAAAEVAEETTHKPPVIRLEPEEIRQNILHRLELGPATREQLLISSGGTKTQFLSQLKYLSQNGGCHYDNQRRLWTIGPKEEKQLREIKMEYSQEQAKDIDINPEKTFTVSALKTELAELEARAENIKSAIKHLSAL